MKKLNLNSTIKFRLNDRGRDIFYHRFDELNEFIQSRGCQPLEPTFPNEDENGYSSFQVWEFMFIYGKYCGMGFPEFWEDLNLYIDETDLEDAQE